MKNKNNVPRTIYGKRGLTRMTLYITPILVLLTASASHAYADHATWKAGWGLDLDSNPPDRLEAKGGETYMTPLSEPSVPSGARASGWIGASNPAGNRWIQIGWYKGTAVLDPDCPSQTSMQIYVEIHEDARSCSTHGSLSSGTGHIYSVYVFTFIGGDFWSWKAALDGVEKDSAVLPFQKGVIEAFIEIKHNDTTTTDTRFSSLRYLSDGGSWTNWPYRDIVCVPNKYVTEKEFEWTQFRAYSSTSSTCS
jgi:hypothetical protein